jgi:hypothetical protein
MKRIISIFCFVVFCIGCFAQIHLTPYVPKTIEEQSPIGYSVLLSKLTSIITSNVLIVSGQDERFILTSLMNEQSKTIISSAPVQIAYVLNVSLCIADGMTGDIFASCELISKGVGETESKAYQNAIKNMKTNTENISSFILGGSKRIIDYYEQNKDAIFSNVDACLSVGDYNQAAYILNLVPQECSFYKEAQDKTQDVYVQMIETEANQFYIRARGLWASNQDKSAAEEAVSILSEISPLSMCYGQAQELIGEIYQKVELINNRNWSEYKRQQEHRRQIEVLEANAQMKRDEQNARIYETAIKESASIRKQRINAVRDVAVAYARTRPRVVYHVHGWF